MMSLFQASSWLGAITMAIAACGDSDPGSNETAGETEAVDTDDGGGSAETGGEPSAPLVGTWRIVEFETTGAAPLRLSDQNLPVTLAGIGIVAGRVNGFMTIRDSHISFASALLFDDHIFPDPLVTNYATAMQVRGGSAPGTLTDDTFTLSGSPIAYAWSRNGDGTITQIDDDGSITTWARIEEVPTADALLAEGQAAMFQGGTPTPMQQPRFAVAWDLPGGPGLEIEQSTALAFVTGYAFYPVTANAAPATARVDLDGTEVAVGHLLVFDDLDGDGTYDPASTDELRADSPVGIAYRSAGPSSAAFENSRFASLRSGWQYVHFHEDFARGGITMAPFDPTVFVAPDIVVDAGPRPDPVTDVVP